MSAVQERLTLIPIKADNQRCRGEEFFARLMKPTALAFIRCNKTNYQQICISLSAYSCGLYGKSDEVSGKRMRCSQLASFDDRDVDPYSLIFVSQCQLWRKQSNFNFKERSSSSEKNLCVALHHNQISLWNLWRAARGSFLASLQWINLRWRLDYVVNTQCRAMEANTALKKWRTLCRLISCGTGMISAAVVPVKWPVVPVKCRLQEAF